MDKRPKIIGIENAGAIIRDPANFDVARDHFLEWARTIPDVGLIVGAVQLGDDANTWADLVDCNAVHLVAFAEALLLMAAQKLAALPDPPRDLIAQVEASRAALLFEEPECVS